MSSYFITATDTDAGKTYVTSLLLQQARLNKIPAKGLKPIASGISENEITDLDFILTAMKNDLTANDINIYRFKPAIAPHIAAQQMNQEIEISKLLSWTKQQESNRLTFIEGVGGLYVPLNQKHSQINLIQCLNIPVIVIVNIKTGCINHALLTFNKLKESGIKLSAWIANKVESDIDIENIKSIEQFSGIPCSLQLPKVQLSNSEIYLKIKEDNELNPDIQSFLNRL